MSDKRLKILAISDTHLGEETSLLSFPRGLQHLWETLAGDPEFWSPIFGEGYNPERDGKVEVEELVLLGDIPDRTLSSTSQLSAATHAFSMMAGSALDIKKAVYVPGNHDHTLWSGYLEAEGRGRSGVTGPEGEEVVRDGALAKKGAEELASIFFGYPLGWAWDEIERRRRGFVFEVANPVYATKAGECTYAFAHGTHFREELYPSRARTALSFADRFWIDKVVMGIDFEAIGHDLEEAENIEDLERRVTPFVDSFWPSSENVPTSRSDDLWYLMTVFGEKAERGRKPPQESRIFGEEDLWQVSEERIHRLTDEEGRPRDGSLERFRKYFLRHLETHLGGEIWQGEDRLTFVYGDTHHGGFGRLDPGRGSRIRVYNTGSWVVPPDRRHPACHLFAVDDAGAEYLLDVAFHDGVKVGNQTLLDLAASDVENRLKAASGLVRGARQALDWLS